MGLIKTLPPMQIKEVFPVQTEKPKQEGQKVKQSFSSMLSEVNSQQNEANKKVENMLTGENKNIPATMISMQKAEVSMRMLLVTQQKVISAYKEVMHMQI